MRHANIELLPEGGARVWAEFPNIPAALKAVQSLLNINPEAFAPVKQCAQTIAYQEGHMADGAGLVCDEIVATAVMRDLLRDDDEGIPGEPPRCLTGSCGVD